MALATQYTVEDQQAQIGSTFESGRKANPLILQKQKAAPLHDGFHVGYPEQLGPGLTLWSLSLHLFNDMLFRDWSCWGVHGPMA